MCAAKAVLRLRPMDYWLAAIFFLIIIACLCVIVHWQGKRRRAKT